MSQPRNERKRRDQRRRTVRHEAKRRDHRKALTSGRRTRTKRRARRSVPMPHIPMAMGGYFPAMAWGWAAYRASSGR